MQNTERARARATPRRGDLPDEIVVWEILVRLPPKSLLRCRSACHAWRRVTCTRGFLLAHHGRQPSLPLLFGDDRYIPGVHYHNAIGVQCHDILAFDHLAATDDDEQLHTVAQLDRAINLEASCDGLLVLSKPYTIGYCAPCLSICNPATREHAPLRLPWDLVILGMYSHHPTGEYRLLLRSRRKVADHQGSKNQFGCYVFVLGSDQPPRYIGWPEMASGLFKVPVRVCDSLHWYPVYFPKNTWMCESKQVVVFDTIAESFRQMRAPGVPIEAYIFETDGMLGIYGRDYAMKNIDIWVLQNYESEVWDLKYQIKLPVDEIRRKFVDGGDHGDLSVVSVDGGVLLLVKVDEWVLHVDNDGNLVNSFQ